MEGAQEEGGAEEGAETSRVADGTDPNTRGDEDEIMSEEILVRFHKNKKCEDVDNMSV